MGEMTDYILDSIDEDEPLYDYGGTLACRCCGKGQLHWGQLDSGKWVLTNPEGTIHECPVNPLRTSKGKR